jgi:peptidoglycan L-alanyl-D-glutamate endopeptidase CwlK
MSLLSDQASFAADVCLRLVPFILQNGIDVITFGEAERTQEQEAYYVSIGRSVTSNSMHLKRCAIDLNMLVIINGSFAVQSNKVALQPIGDFWESLDVKNKWGGNWTDPYDPAHFQRTV